MLRTYSVYILASRSRNLYVGVTGNLHKRMLQHRQGLVPGFTTQYRIFRLVHLEHFADARDAIAREKEIKGWRREKKIRLIKGENPTWQDLAQSIPSQKADPSHRPPNPGARVRDDNTNPNQARSETARQRICHPEPTAPSTNDCHPEPMITLPAKRARCHPEPARAFREWCQGSAVSSPFLLARLRTRVVIPNHARPHEPLPSRIPAPCAG